MLNPPGLSGEPQLPLYAYTFANLYRKNLLSTTPRNEALNALIFALKASAAAFVLLFTK